MVIDRLKNKESDVYRSERTCTEQVDGMYCSTVVDEIEDAASCFGFLGCRTRNSRTANEHV
jgi:hypothetical protein